MYMGEIVRLVIIDMANENKLFDGNLSHRIRKYGVFCTAYVSDIEKYVLTCSFIIG